MKNYCVYTCLFGQYEELNEQPTAHSSSIPYICFTDDPKLTSSSWQIKVISPLLIMDPLRSHRVVKIKPWDFLPEYDASLYIDNSVILKTSAEEIFTRYNIEDDVGIAQHDHREKVLDEFIAVASLGFDDQTRIFEQLNHYLISQPEVLNEKPFWGGMLIRSHKNRETRMMAEIWLAHVFRYSRRDQLSLNLAIRNSGVKIKSLEIANFTSWCHDWPISHKRDRERGPLNTALTLNMPLAAERMRDLKLTEEAKQLANENIRLVANQKSFNVFKTLTFAFLATTFVLSCVLIRVYFL